MSQHAQKHPFHLVDPSPWPFVGALGALGVGLALFGMGKAVAGVGSAVGDAAMETGALLTDNPIYKEAGFGAKIKKEVETLLSIGGTTNEALTEGGTFLVMMTAVAAGLAVFGVAFGMFVLRWAH